MNSPRLVRPVQISIQPLLRSATKMDREAREPVGRPSYGPVVVIPGQVYGFTHFSVPNYDQLGVDETVKLVATVRRIDLESLGYTPKRGDMVTALGQVKNELYLLVSEQMAHKGAFGGPGLYRLYFSDRRPAVSKPNMV